MTKAGKSLFYFGIYVALVGLLFLTIPGALVSLAKLPPVPEGWARIIGLLALIVAACDIISGRNNVSVLIRASIYIRLGFTAGIVLLVLTKQMSSSALLFGVIDTLGAIWTAVALKSEKSNQ